MGKFIITRTTAGDRFSLKSDSGRTLAVSRHYATLDACKKGIASLVIHAPLMPVVDATAGEYGKNPKFEVVSDAKGVRYLAKSPNGKTVITSPVYATKKACLRAISMLRSGVLDFEILFYNSEGYTPIVMKALDGISPTSVAKGPRKAEPEKYLPKPLDAEKLSGVPESVDDESEISQPTPRSNPPKAPTVPRLIRLQPTKKPSPEAQEKAENVKPRYGIFQRFLKK